MSTPPPLPLVYEGDGVFRAPPRFKGVCAEHFGQGEVITFVAHEERSLKSHGHYFAVLHEIWLNLPEDLSDRWINEDQFRKHALIATGHRDERSIVCASKAEAQRVAAFLKPMDEYAVVLVREAVITVYTAKSQSMRAMGKEAFAKSKDDVLSWAAAQAETSVGAAAENARRVA
jgi:hypothetical protein